MGENRLEHLKLAGGEFEALGEEVPRLWSEKLR